MTQSVWLVEEGEYSSYHIVGVFSTEANAQLVAERDPHMRIVERPLDPAVAELSQGWQQFLVDILRDGTIQRCEAYDGVIADDDCEPVLSPARRYPGADFLLLTVWARDEQHAAKVANEKRTQFIAEGKWD
jgi:hypothetical protein